MNFIQIEKKIHSEQFSRKIVHSKRSAALPKVVSSDAESDKKQVSKKQYYFSPFILVLSLFVDVHLIALLSIMIYLCTSIRFYASSPY